MDHSSPVDALYDAVSKAGVPMAEVCRRAGVAQSTPARWRSEVFEPRLRTVKKLRAALEQIQGDQDTMPIAAE